MLFFAKKVEEDTMSSIAQKNEIFVNDEMDKIECKLLDGKSISGQLERPFLPVEGEVVIRSEGKVHVLPLDQICCVVFKGDSENNDSHHMYGEKIENIVTRGNETYLVRLLHEEPTDNLPHGFYAIPTNQESGCSRIFFSRTGIINRKENSQLGEIINEADDVSKENIESALSEQERLKKRKVGEIISEQFDIPQESIDKAVQKRKVGEIISEQFDIPQASIDKAVDKVKNTNKYSSHRIGDILISFGLATKSKLTQH